MTAIHRPKPLGIKPCFGFGDRTGLATPGHLHAYREYDGPIKPVFAQQSIRELERTGRSPSDVIENVADSLRSGSFRGDWGADADHLRTLEEINSMAGAGFVLYTLDPSQYVDYEVDNDDAKTIERKFHVIKCEIPWIDSYFGRVIHIDGGLTIEMDDATVKRTAVKYGRAVLEAIKMSEHIDSIMSKRKRDYEIELSIAHSPRPTTPAEHFLIVERCLLADMRLVGLSLRYMGEFEQGVDYRGDIGLFTQFLQAHAAIARQLGEYKLSLHAGSDKLSLYEIIARETRGRFHIKTSGTSYLESLRVASQCDRTLFREIIDFSRERFNWDRATFQVSAQLERVPPPAAVTDDRQLESIYLDGDDGRQILHVTFGSVLTNDRYGPLLKDLLISESNIHVEVLASCFKKHLDALARGM